MSRLHQYLSALFSDWIGHMSGWASVLLTAIALIWPSFFANVRHLRAAMWASAAVCLLIVNFHAWLRERKALESEIKKKEGSNLQGSIRLGYIDKRRFLPPTGWEDISRGCLVTVYVDAVNHNPQLAYPRTDVSGIQIKLNGETHEGRWLHVVDGLAVDDDRVSIKTLNDWFDGIFQGMPQSIPKLGYMQFLVPSIANDIFFGKDSIRVDATVIIVDTLGKKHLLRNQALDLLVGKLCTQSDLLYKVRPQ
jgi:hypothetical protein